MVLSPSSFIPKKLNKSVTMGIAVMIGQMFLLINADFVFGSHAPAVKETLIMYLLFLAVILAYTNRKLPTFEEQRKRKGQPDISHGMAFIIGFIVTALVMFFFVMGSPYGAWLASLEGVTLIVGFAFLHGFTKAYIEEMVFRDVLPIGLKLGDFISNILFAAFHFAALTRRATLAISIGEMSAVGFWPFVIYGSITLFVLGMIWAYVLRDRVGIMGAVGSHFAYNLAVLGALTALFA